jgi:hypothetical protein
MLIKPGENVNEPWRKRSGMGVGEHVHSADPELATLS